MRNLTTILALIIFVGSVIGAFFFGRASVDIPEISTNIERDTASYSKPLPDTVEKITTIYIKVPDSATTPENDVADSVSVEVVERDSSEVAVDIERRVYQDSSYRAVVSGAVVGDIHPTLESMDIYSKTETRIIEHKAPMFRPYLRGSVGRDALGIGGGVSIKDRVDVDVQYMRIGNSDMAVFGVNYRFNIKGR